MLFIRCDRKNASFEAGPLHWKFRKSFFFKLKCNQGVTAETTRHSRFEDCAGDFSDPSNLRYAF
ncbi:Hypothetical predicted protein [Paramuricea clavata]|uniref:Uncharacterized protein n=1 Tax=Paramuricea clavata TaxID=317549 RepID=A0A6S7HWE5_PARCT|nr:Hypothetical predicted protein [Paramuricea clavata]